MKSLNIFLKPKFIILILFIIVVFFPKIRLSQSKTKHLLIDSQHLQYEVTVTLKLVQVYVTDKNGNPVTNLEKSDFLVWDNGKPVKITDFEKHILFLPSRKKLQEIKPSAVAQIQPPMNRKFFFFFDFAFNDAAGILKARKAALHFIDTELRPTDEVAVVSYSARKGLTLHEYLSADHQQIRKVIEGIGIAVK